MKIIILRNRIYFIFQLIVNDFQTSKGLERQKGELGIAGSNVVPLLLNSAGRRLLGRGSAISLLCLRVGMKFRDREPLLY